MTKQSWCSVFGIYTMDVLHNFFDANEEYRKSDEWRQEYALCSLDMMRFAYRKARGDDKRVSTSINDKYH